METQRTAGGPERIADLTVSVFGERLSLQQVFARVERVDLPARPVWVGSIGYERFRDNAVFAGVLSDAGVSRLVDVRELPISRKRGFAKTALAAACDRVGVEYRHVKDLGNPKPIRDLYKSGFVAEGRVEYERFLLNERGYALDSLAEMLGDGRTALMCVEHDQSICHRDVIFGALAARDGFELQIVDL